LSFQRELAPQRGVTSVLVPTHYPTDNFLKALQALDGEGKLTVRYDVSLWADETRGTSQILEFIDRRNRYKGKFFKSIRSRSSAPASVLRARSYGIKRC
jgi:hypothetical protein